MDCDFIVLNGKDLWTSDEAPNVLDLSIVKIGIRPVDIEKGKNKYRDINIFINVINVMIPITCFRKESRVISKEPCY